MGWPRSAGCDARAPGDAASAAASAFDVGFACGARGCGAEASTEADSELCGASTTTFASAPKLVSLVETLPGNPAHADIASSTSSPTASSVAATADAPCQAAWELLPAKSDRAPARSGAAFDRSWSGEEAATDGIDGTLALEPKPDAGGPPALARDPVSELSTVASTSDSIWATRESSAPDGAGESASRPPARSNGAGALFVTRFGWTMILPKPAFLLYAAMGLSICS
mmetsp:Transcript_48682/g.128778  ORF Transcript_48682/g.128778 Transcript_48682/m.128778 type:complete len:228 (+) Transcript_48682:938-1621(+)